MSMGATGVICVNVAHHRDADATGPLGCDPRLHLADETPCVPYGAPARPVGQQRASEKRYRTIVVDPPWAYTQKWGKELSSAFFKGGTKRGAACHYETMTQVDLIRLPVDQWAEDDAHLYLWTTNAFMLEAHELMRFWGFSYKTMITWVKNQIGMGMYFRNTTEHILFGVRGKLKCQRKDVVTHLLAPRGQHSEKPAAFYDMAESMSPGPYLDVFARAHRFNWAVFGDQVYSDIPLVQP